MRAPRWISVTERIRRASLAWRRRRRSARRTLLTFIGRLDKRHPDLLKMVALSKEVYYEHYKDGIAPKTLTRIASLIRGAEERLYRLESLAAKQPGKYRRVKDTAYAKVKERLREAYKLMTANRPARKKTN